MKTAEFEQFVKLGVIGSVMILDCRKSDLGFQLFAYGKWEEVEQNTEIERRGNAIEAARGGNRKWSDLVRLIDFVRECGWNGKLEIEAI